MIVNKTRYNDSEKPMKKINFIVKNLGENLPKKQFIVVKRNFKSNTKPLSLYSTILVNEFIIEIFFCFRTSELSNI